MAFRIINKIKKYLRTFVFRKYGYKHPKARISRLALIYKPENLFVHECTGISAGSIIMNWNAKFIMKKFSGASLGLKVITGNHMRVNGKYFKQVTDIDKSQLNKNNEFDQDVVVDEDVWMGAYVTLLNGTHIGRGCNIGSGSVVRGNIPPYAVVYGNPAKIVGFVFTPKEIVKHEMALYPEDERIPLETLEKNYKKYFLNRIKEIKDFTHI